MWTYLLGPFLALLPRRWRDAVCPDAPIAWGQAALLSGVMEASGCLLGLSGWYLFSVRQQMSLTLTATKGTPGETSAYMMGLGFVGFALHPLTWALAYFWVEGTVRTLATACAGETLGTLPLVLVDWMVDRVQRRNEPPEIPMVPDIVTRGDGSQPWDLKVESCRPNPGWKYPLLVRYIGESFQVIGLAPLGGTPERPHVYLLRYPRPGETFRVAEPDGAESGTNGEAAGEAALNSCDTSARKSGE